MNRTILWISPYEQVEHAGGSYNLYKNDLRKVNGEAERENYK